MVVIKFNFSTTINNNTKVDVDNSVFNKEKIINLKNLYIGQIEHLEGSNLIKIPTSTYTTNSLYSLNEENVNAKDENNYYELSINNNATLSIPHISNSSPFSENHFLLLHHIISLSF